MAIFSTLNALGLISAYLPCNILSSNLYTAMVRIVCLLLEHADSERKRYKSKRFDKGNNTWPERTPYQKADSETNQYAAVRILCKFLYLYISYYPSYNQKSSLTTIMKLLNENLKNMI
ncbi:hypothetical protein D5770_13010 [Salmonella enterica subsp. enterica]|nr:hypothetical protein [Salmonella enterica subsp. enterica serovar Schwarzengrund]ECI5766640.1 hypothetical protein [Salmonella enterica subsp. enterica]